MLKFWNFQKNQATRKNELWIEGDIEDISDVSLYEYFEADTKTTNAFREELRQYAGEDLDIYIDTYGGDVFAGLGIYADLKAHEGKKTVLVNAKAMSAGSIIACAGDEIIMAKGAILMVHDPMTAVTGNIADMESVLGRLNAVKEGILNIYEERTGKTRAELSELMTKETYMSAETALEMGFITSIAEHETRISNSGKEATLLELSSQKMLAGIEKIIKEEEVVNNNADRLRELSLLVETY
jgi:ATP-dependent Clp protease, protease subunit